MQTFSEKQLLALKNSYARINVAEGAVSSGKSFIFLIRFLEELVNGPPGEYMIGGKSETTVLRNVVKPLDNMIGGILRYNQSRRQFTLFERDVYIVGANDERAEGKIRGLTLAGALIDEGTLMPYSFFKMTLSRLRVPHAKLFVTTNPDSKFHWLKTDFLDKFADDPDQLAHFQFRLDDNPYLTESYKSSLKKEYSGLWYKRFIEGEWVQAEGAIYDFFDDEFHVVKTPPTYAKYYLLGVDYGTTNPFAAVLIGFNDDHHPTLWVEKEYYWDSKAMGYQKTDAEYANDLEREFRAYNPRLVYLDPSAQSFEVELRRKRWPIKQAKNEVLDGIRTVATYLSQGDLVICKNCTNLLKEIESYVWDEKSVRLGEDKPVKMRDHALDALRYVLHSHYGQKTTLKETNKDQNFQSLEQKRFNQNPMAYPGYVGSNGWQKY
jgi:PBSX family phage terminase large subunit